MSTSKSLKKQLVLLEEQLKRAVADYHNLESRVGKEIGKFKRTSLLSLVDKLLGVLDDLQRAEKNIKNKGLTMAVNQFEEVLVSEGVEEIKTDGEKFDPQSMDCAEMGKGKKNIVIKTLLKGYSLDGQVIRPAKVRVGQGGKK